MATSRNRSPPRGASLVLRHNWSMRSPHSPKRLVSHAFRRSLENWGHRTLQLQRYGAGPAAANRDAPRPRRRRARCCASRRRPGVRQSDYMLNAPLAKNELFAAIVRCECESTTRVDQQRKWAKAQFLPKNEAAGRHLRQVRDNRRRFPACPMLAAVNVMVDLRHKPVTLSVARQQHDRQAGQY